MFPTTYDRPSLAITGSVHTNVHTASHPLGQVLVKLALLTRTRSGWGFGWVQKIGHTIAEATEEQQGSRKRDTRHDTSDPEGGFGTGLPLSRPLVVHERKPQPSQPCSCRIQCK